MGDIIGRYPADAKPVSEAGACSDRDSISEDAAGCVCMNTRIVTPDWNPLPISSSSSPRRSAHSFSSILIFQSGLPPFPWIKSIIPLPSQYPSFPNANGLVLSFQWHHHVAASHRLAFGCHLALCSERRPDDALLCALCIPLAAWSCRMSRLLEVFINPASNRLVA